MKCDSRYCRLWNSCPTEREFTEYHPKHPENKPFPLPACYQWPTWGKDMADGCATGSF